MNRDKADDVIDKLNTYVKNLGKQAGIMTIDTRDVVASLIEMLEVIKFLNEEVDDLKFGASRISSQVRQLRR